MAQRNIDFGSFPDDPNADAIRTAFNKVQQNFNELFSGLQDQAVISVNRTSGQGITVNSPTGNVIVSANIAQVRIESTTLDLSTGSNATPGPIAFITSGSVPFFINLPANVTGVSNITLGNTLIANTVNVNLQLNGNTASFSGNITTTANNNANNANVTNLLTVGGNANVTGNLNVTANANVTANVNAGNVVTSGLVSATTSNVSGNVNANIVNANYFYGDGSNITNVSALANTRIVNGTSWANIPDTGGNLNIVITGNSTMVVTSTGANIAGYATVTGNVTAPNFVGNLANGNSSISIPAVNGNIVLNAANGTAEVTVTSSGVNVSGTLNATGNANVANLGTGRVIATGNISGTQLISNIATGTAPLVVTSTTKVANLNAELLDGYDTATAATASTVAVRDANGSMTANVYIGSGANLTNLPGSNVSGQVANALVSGTVYTNAQPNITSVGTLSSLAVTGNASAGNLNTAGKVVASTLESNVATGTAPFAVASTTRVANLNVAYANVADFTNVSTQSSGNAYLLFGNALTGNINETANATFVANTSNGALYATTFVGTLSGAASTAGTVTTSAQPNITSVGTLTSLGVNGTVTAVAFTANTGVFTGNGSGLSSIAGANVTGTVSSATTATTAGTVTTAAQPNITSVGTLSSLGVTGNITSGNVYANAGTIGALLLTGTLTTASQPNITSVGTLSSLTVSGNITSGNANLGNLAKANFFQGDGSLLTNITVSAGTFIESGTSNVSIDLNGNVKTSVSGNANILVVTGTGANVTGYANVSGNINAGNVIATLFTGTLSTAAQPNVTSLGNLTSLNVAGVSNLGPNGNVIITGGVANAFLMTNGSGNLTWNTATLVPAQGSNAQVIFNDGGSTYAGNANLTFNKTTGALAVGGNLSAGNISGANNITANFFTGTLRTNAQPNITSVGTLTGLNVNNTITAVSITANTGVFTGNASGLTAIPGANVTGTVANATYATSAGTATSATSATSATTAGTVTTNAQPNITSVGTLTGLIVNGNINAGNIAGGNAVSANFFIGSGANLTAIPGANVTGTVANATAANTVLTNTAATGTVYPAFVTSNANSWQSLLTDTGISANLSNNSISATTFVGSLSGAATSATTAGTVTTAAQPNITSVGTLTSLIVSGNINAGNISGGNAVSANFFIGSAANLTNIPGGNVSGQVANALVSGTVYTNAQPNITSVGTLTSLSVTGNISAGNISGGNAVSANFFIGSAANLTNIPGGNVTGQVANALVSGTVYTAAQPNITSTGTLTGLTVSGNITAQANVTVTGYRIRSVGTGIAAAGTVQGNATAITKEMNVVSTVATGAGVILPTAVAGMVISITNISANSLLVYPHVGGDINGAAANAAYTQPSGATLQYIAPTTTDWYTVGATFA